MSEVFECVVVAAPKSAVADRLHDLVSLVDNHVLEVEQIGNHSIIYWNFSHRREFGNFGEQICALFSRYFERAVLARYDSGTCFRYSSLFTKGIQDKSFQLADEKWALLDDEARPDPSQGVFLISEMVKGKEYETIENAIQLGLNELGFGDWKRLLEMMAHL
ncbi:hypothetical protein J0H58_02480 [bacterium]|nr:hypothetical protein [bacterium]